MFTSTPCGLGQAAVLTPPPATSLWVPTQQRPLCSPQNQDRALGGRTKWGSGRGRSARGGHGTVGWRGHWAEGNGVRTTEAQLTGQSQGGEVTPCGTSQ